MQFKPYAEFSPESDCHLSYMGFRGKKTTEKKKKKFAIFPVFFAFFREQGQEENKELKHFDNKTPNFFRKGKCLFFYFAAC